MVISMNRRTTKEYPVASLFSIHRCWCAGFSSLSWLHLIVVGNVTLMKVLLRILMTPIVLQFRPPTTSGRSVCSLRLLYSVLSFVCLSVLINPFVILYQFPSYIIINLIFSGFIIHSPLRNFFHNP